MLCLPALRSIGDCTLFSDGQDPRRHYFVPGNPRLSLRADGGPELSLARWEGDDGKGGGQLAFEVDLALSPSELQALKAQLPAGSTLEPPPWTGIAVAASLAGGGLLGSATPRVTLLDGARAWIEIPLDMHGASLVESLLLDGGLEASLQIRYSLGFLARTPPVRVAVHVRTTEVIRRLRALYEKEGLLSASRIETSFSDSRIAGEVDVRVEGGPGLDETALSELTGQAMQMALEALAETWLVPLEPGAGIALRIGSFAFGADLDRQVKEIDIVIEQQTVLPWRLFPAGGLGTLPPSIRASRIRRLEPAGAVERVPVTVVAAFGSSVESVEVQLRQEAADRPEATLVFSHRETQHWRPREPAAALLCRWRAITSGGPGAWSAWEPRSGAVNLVVPEPEPPMLRVVASGLDLHQRVYRAQASIWPEGSEDSTVEVLLDAIEPELSIPRPGPERLLARSRVLLRTGETLEDPEPWPVEGGILVLREPRGPDLLKGAFLPTGDGWDEVDTVYMDLVPEGQPSERRAWALRSPHDLVPWAIGLPEGAEAIELRQITCFLDGRMQTGPWVRQHGGGVILVPVEKVPQLRLELLPTLLDLASCPRTEVELKREENERKSFVFTEPQPRSWTLPMGPARFTVQITHHPPGQDPVRLPPFVHEGPVLVLPPWRPAGQPFEIRVRADLLDFSAHPSVEVELEPLAGSGSPGRLVFDAPGEERWSFQPGTEAPRYRYRIRRGEQDPGPWQEGGRPILVLPRA